MLAQKGRLNLRAAIRVNKYGFFNLLFGQNPSGMKLDMFLTVCT